MLVDVFACPGVGLFGPADATRNRRQRATAGEPLRYRVRKPTSHNLGGKSLKERGDGLVGELGDVGK